MNIYVDGLDNKEEACNDNKPGNIDILKLCKQGNVSALRGALQHTTKLDLNVRDENGGTSLHEVAMHTCQFSEILKLLLEHGAYVDAQDFDGNTPLHQAVLFHCVENVKEILKYNPDLTITNHENVSAIDFARNLEDDEIEILLTGMPHAHNKNKSRKGRRTARSVLRKLHSFLPAAPILSPSILKKRKFTGQAHEDDANPSKKQCVRFELAKDINEE